MYSFNLLVLQYVARFLVICRFVSFLVNLACWDDTLQQVCLVRSTLTIVLSRIPITDIFDKWMAWSQGSPVVCLAGMKTKNEKCESKTNTQTNILVHFQPDMQFIHNVTVWCVREMCLPARLS